MARQFLGLLVGSALSLLAACGDTGDKAAPSEAGAEDLREVDLSSPDVAIADETPLDPAGAQASDDPARGAMADPLAGTWPEAAPPAPEPAAAASAAGGVAATSNPTAPSTPGEAR
jgi:hypothetical protein